MFIGQMLIAAFLALMAGLPDHEPETYRIVVNSANQATSLTKEQVSKLFLKVTKTWEGGVVVSPVDLSEKSPVREKFSRDIHTRPTTAVVTYWQQVAFSDRGEPPLSFETDRDVLAYVRLKPGAIGYVSAAADTEGVKVISIVK